jgi:hypothetical protein
MKGLPTPMNPGERFAAVAVIAGEQMRENTLVTISGLTAYPADSTAKMNGSIVSDVDEGDLVWMVYRGQAEARTK